MDSEPRRLKALQNNIEALGPNEHGVLLQMISDSVHCDRNVNGFFCDLSALQPQLLDTVEQFVEYSLANNKGLEEHDRSMHAQLQLLQRVPSCVSESVAKSSSPGLSVRRAMPAAKADAAFSNKGAKLAFIKRASDSTPRRKAGEDAVEAFERPVFIRRNNSDAPRVAR